MPSDRTTKEQQGASITLWLKIKVWGHKLSKLYVIICYAPVCIISTAQHARPKVMGQMLPLRAQLTRESTFEITYSAAAGFTATAAAFVAILMRWLQKLGKLVNQQLIRALIDNVSVEGTQLGLCGDQSQVLKYILLLDFTSAGGTIMLLFYKHYKKGWAVALRCT